MERERTTTFIEPFLWKINRFRLRCKVTFVSAFRILRGFLQLESQVLYELTLDWLIHKEKEIVPTSVEVYPEPYGTSLIAPVSYLFYDKLPFFSVCVYTLSSGKAWTQTNITNILSN